ncbi:TetR/AcrR family transcriptional regulator [Modestobacter sp. Leaf380]|uniref:TetR/AcrR family transcriptional regulator n=1 Tax=Modestobacter sp. Leaf380 TaxID=1736356 RepID=UPI0006FB5090|nr:TetR/AcrR family transcriptional regulator [Modestobacter sp. Leaf380]KQS65707.1 hypothetical protein ASG41_13965 [Modestobacter sp. Leaf380]
MMYDGTAGSATDVRMPPQVALHVVRRPDRIGGVRVATPSLRQALQHFRARLQQYDWSTQTDSRRRILEVYLQLALVKGFNGVTMRMIASELRIKAPSLYAHFPQGRDEIVSESMRWHFHKFGDAVLTELAQVATPDDAWTALVRVHVSRQLQLPESNLWDLLIATDRMVGLLPPEVSREADELVGHYEQVCLAAAVEMGYTEADHGLAVVMTLLEGATRWCGTVTDPLQLATHVRRADELSRAMLALTATWGPIAHEQVG